jgi:signal peptidase I
MKNKLFSKHSCITVVFVVALSLGGCKEQEYRVNGSSMAPTFKDGDVLTSSPVKFSKIQRGDVIVISSPVEGGGVWILRVVGLPKERITWNDERFVVNEEIISLKQLGVDVIGEKSEGMEAELKKDELYVLGDNMGEARDSREFGPIKQSTVLGKIDVK